METVRTQTVVRVLRVDPRAVLAGNRAAGGRGDTSEMYRYETGRESERVPERPQAEPRTARRDLVG